MSTTTEAGSPLVQLTLARIREFFREPAAVFWVYVFPLGLALALGTAFKNRPIERISIDISADPADAAAVTAADELKAKLEADPRVKVRVADYQSGRNRLRTAKTDLVLVPVSATTADPTSAAGYDYLLEPNRPESVLARNAADSILLRASRPNEPVPREVVIDEPGGRYIDFLLPALIGTNLMGGGLWGVGFVIVDMRVRKLLKRYLATPMRRTDFLLSIMISRFVFTLLEVLVLLGFGWLVFGVPVRGNFLELLALMALGGFSFAGIGLLVACRAKTIETVSGLMNAVMLPMYLLSGVFFSAERFGPEVLPLIKLLPLTALNDALRAVMLDGTHLTSLVPECLNLAVWGVVSFALALKLFRWQ
jgi:hypothetical protein